jgi:hypothetical protein
MVLKNLEGKVALITGAEVRIERDRIRKWLCDRAWALFGLRPANGPDRGGHLSRQGWRSS